MHTQSFAASQSAESISSFPHAKLRLMVLSELKNRTCFFFIIKNNMGIFQLRHETFYFRVWLCRRKARKNKSKCDMNFYKLLSRCNENEYDVVRWMSQLTLNWVYSDLLLSLNILITVMFWKLVREITTFPISEKLSDSIYLVKLEITTCESLLHYTLKCNPSAGNFLRVSRKL